MVVEEIQGIFALTIIIGLILFLFVILYTQKTEPKSININDDTYEEVASAIDALDDSKTKKKDKIKKKDGKTTFSHQWLISSTRPHTSDVLAIDFSPNSKYMATCSEDRSIYIWYVKDFVRKENKHARINVEFDHATRLKFSPDNKAILTSLAIGGTIRIFRLSRKEDIIIGKITTAFDFPDKHKAEIVNIGVACNGKFVMSCYNDTTIKIWSVKGNLFHTIDTLQVNNTHACVSPCSKFVASSGFTSDVKIWEVCFDKSGLFKEVVKAFQLSGHTSGVNSFAFNSDSTRMASVSKDGTWKLWSTDIDYQRRQDPRLLNSWNLGTNLPSMLAMSPDGLVVAIATCKTISIYDVAIDKVAEVMQDVHVGEIRALEFSVDNAYLVSAGDRTINIFHNVVGLRTSIRDLGTKLTASSTKAIKERIKEQISQYKELLKNILKKEKSTDCDSALIPLLCVHG